MLYDHIFYASPLLVILVVFLDSFGVHPLANCELLLTPESSLIILDISLYIFVVVCTVNLTFLTIKQLFTYIALFILLMVVLYYQKIMMNRNLNHKKHLS